MEVYVSHTWGELQLLLERECLPSCRMNLQVSYKPSLFKEVKQAPVYLEIFSEKETLISSSSYHMVLLVIPETYTRERNLRKHSLITIGSLAQK